MTTWTQPSKSSAPAYSQPSKSSTSYGSINQVKAGQSWLMGQAGITMGGVLDPVSLLPVYMGALGTSTLWTTINES